MISLTLATILFVYGLIFGSFFNVVAIRMLKGESIVFPPSHCVSCNHRLHILDLVPLFSYIFLKGNCRYCGESISKAYPIGEAAAGCLFAMMAWRFGWSAELFAALLFVSVLLIVVQTDLRAMIIPNRIVYPSIVIALALRLFIAELPYWHYAGSAVLGYLLLFVIGWTASKLMNKEALGGGDLKLFAFVGAILGIKLLLLAIFLASLIGCLVGLIMLSLRRLDKGSYLPFGPFIALGALVSYIWGDPLIDLYLQLIRF